MCRSNVLVLLIDIDDLQAGAASMLERGRICTLVLGDLVASVALTILRYG